MDPYSEIFEAYLNDLRVAREDATGWWRALLSQEIAACGDEKKAKHALRLRWPLGPVTYPRVIAVYRKYYLLIDVINRDLVGDEQQPPRSHPLDDDAWVDDEEGVPVQHPRAVLYERLDEVDAALARFMDPLVFVPIGADRDGRLV